MILMELPNFCVKNAAKKGVSGDAGESRSREGGWGIGEVRHAEAGEDAEGQVEEPDVEGSEWPEDWGSGNGEIGYQPEGAWVGVVCDGSREAHEFGLGKAVEEKVGDDEVGAGGRDDIKRRRLEGSDALDERLATVAEELEHSGAGIHCHGCQMGPVGEQLGQKAAVTVAKQQRLVARWELS